MRKLRFPLVERALADVPALADPEFAAGIRRHAENLVRRSRGLPGTHSFFFPLYVLFFLRLDDWLMVLVWSCSGRWGRTGAR